MGSTGSLTEHRVREELTALQKWFVSHFQFEHFIDAIEEYVPDPTSAMVLEGFPDDGEYVITFLVNGEHLVTMEIDQQLRKTPEVVNHRTIKPTNHGLKRQDQIRLSIALAMNTEAGLWP